MGNQEKRSEGSKNSNKVTNNTGLSVSNRVAPLYLNSEPLAHACGLFLENYGREVDLQKWTLNAAQNMFMAGQNCQVAQGTGFLIQKPPLTSLHKLFDDLPTFDALTKLYDLITQLNDVCHSYAIVGFFFCFRSHALHEIDYDLPEEKRVEYYRKLIQKFIMFSKVYSKLLNGVRYGLSQEVEEPLFEEILASLPTPQHPRVEFKSKKFNELLDWQKEFCRRYHIVETNESTSDSLKTLADQNRLSKMMFSLFCSLLSYQTEKKRMLIFGEKQENMICLFKKVDHTLHLCLQRIVELEAKVALLESSGLSIDTPKSQNRSLSQSKQSTQNKSKIQNKPSETIRGRISTRELENLFSDVNKENLRRNPNNETPTQGGKKLICCARCQEDKPHHGYGLCARCYSLNKKEKMMCVKCKKKNRVEGRKTCSDCYIKCLKKSDRPGVVQPRCAKCKNNKIKARGLCSTCYNNSSRVVHICKTCHKNQANKNKDICMACYNKNKQNEIHAVQDKGMQVDEVQNGKIQASEVRNSGAQLTETWDTQMNEIQDKEMRIDEFQEQPKIDMDKTSSSIVTPKAENGGHLQPFSFDFTMFQSNVGQSSNINVTSPPSSSNNPFANITAPCLTIKQEPMAEYWSENVGRQRLEKYIEVIDLCSDSDLD